MNSIIFFCRVQVDRNLFSETLVNFKINSTIFFPFRIGLGLPVLQEFVLRKESRSESESFNFTKPNWSKIRTKQKEAVYLTCAYFN